MTLWHKPHIALTRRHALALGAVAGGLALAPRYAAAVVRLDITEGNFQPLPIAIPKFIAGPHDHFNWSGNAINLALMSAAWLIADAFTTPPAHADSKLRRAELIASRPEMTSRRKSLLAICAGPASSACR